MSGDSIFAVGWLHSTDPPTARPVIDNVKDNLEREREERREREKERERKERIK